MHKLAALDHRYVWHPFTQMRDWLATEPIVIESGEGAVLRDARGREYLDANSSIWTNLHGHQHPTINRAIRKQLGKIAHSSALGLANEPASLLAEKLCEATRFPKIFFSDDGSTAMEVALKLAYEFARRRRGLKKPRFLSLAGAYHGDTVGAVSLGHIDLFHKAYSGLLFETDQVMAPYCYRCPFNRAKPERADARTYRKCNWECTGQVAKAFAKQKKSEPYAAFVVEPLMQGAAGMIPQPVGWLRDVAQITRDNGAQLIADEVMTGFKRASDHLLACQSEAVQPDFVAVAKGMTGGYLPMAATLTTQEVFNAFLGNYDEFKTFFHGHSFTGNQLGAAAGLASVKLLENDKPRRAVEGAMREESKMLWELRQVGDIRQVGAVMGIELVRDWKTREPFKLQERGAGIRVCEAMARRGILTRPIGSVIVIMPPFCTTKRQVRRIFSALRDSIAESFNPA